MLACLVAFELKIYYLEPGFIYFQMELKIYIRTSAVKKTQPVQYIKISIRFCLSSSISPSYFVAKKNREQIVWIFLTLFICVCQPYKNAFNQWIYEQCSRERYDSIRSLFFAFSLTFNVHKKVQSSGQSCFQPEQQLSTMSSLFTQLDHLLLVLQYEPGLLIHLFLFSNFSTIKTK